MQLHNSRERLTYRALASTSPPYHSDFHARLGLKRDPIQHSLSRRPILKKHISKSNTTLSRPLLPHLNPTSDLLRNLIQIKLPLHAYHLLLHLPKLIQRIDTINLQSHHILQHQRQKDRISMCPLRHAESSSHRKHKTTEQIHTDRVPGPHTCAHLIG